MNGCKGKDEKMKVGIVKKWNQGFSLIEVLLAIVILGLVAAPILQIFLSSAQVNNRSKEIMAGTELASTTMEYINGCKFNGSNGILEAFTNEDDFCKLPSVGYNIDATNGIHEVDASGVDMDHPTATPADQYALLVGLYKYAKEQTGAGDEVQGCELYYDEADSNYGFAFQNILYNGYTYDMVIWFTNKGESGDVYYTYDVEVAVYLVEEVEMIDEDGDEYTVIQHFENKMISLNGAVANE